MTSTWTYFQAQQAKWTPEHLGQWVAIRAAGHRKFETSSFFDTFMLAYRTALAAWGGRANIAVYRVGDTGVSGVVRTTRIDTAAAPTPHSTPRRTAGKPANRKPRPFRSPTKPRD